MFCDFSLYIFRYTHRGLKSHTSSAENISGSFTHVKSENIDETLLDSTIRLRNLTLAITFGRSLYQILLQGVLYFARFN